MRREREREKKKRGDEHPFVDPYSCHLSFVFSRLLYYFSVFHSTLLSRRARAMVMRHADAYQKHPAGPTELRLLL